MVSKKEIGGKDMNDDKTLDLIRDTELADSYYDYEIDKLYEKLRDANKHKFNLPIYNTPESKQENQKINAEIKDLENKIKMLKQDKSMKKENIKESTYSVSINGLETDDASTLAEILNLTSQLDNEADELSSIGFPEDLEIGIIAEKPEEMSVHADDSLSLVEPEPKDKPEEPDVNPVETPVDEAIEGSKYYYTIYKGVPEDIIETGYATEEDAYHKFEEIANEYNASSESEDEFEDSSWKSFVRICPDEDGLTLDINVNDIEEDEFEDTDELLIEKATKNSDSFEEMVEMLEKSMKEKRE